MFLLLPNSLWFIQKCSYQISTMLVPRIFFLFYFRLMEITLPQINQVILHCATYPRENTINLYRIKDDLSKDVKQGSLTLKFADFTIKLTRSGYINLHLLNRIYFYYTEINEEILKPLASFINSYARFNLHQIDYSIKNVQLTAGCLNFENEALLEYFRLLYKDKIEGHLISIVDTENTPHSIDAKIYSFKCVRLRITSHYGTMVNMVLSITFKGKISVVLNSLTELIVLEEIFNSWRKDAVT